MLALTFWQTTEARKERIGAQDALILANIAKDKTESLLGEVKTQKMLIDLWVYNIYGALTHNLEAAQEKFEEMAKIDPNNYLVFAIWQLTLISYAEQLGIEGKKDKEKEMIERSEKVCLRANDLKYGTGSYTLACIYAYKSDESACKKWLVIAQDTNALSPLSEANSDYYLKAMRDKDWFKQISWPKE
jgi:hypothetical protein